MDLGKEGTTQQGWKKEETKKVQILLNSKKDKYSRSEQITNNVKATENKN